MDLVIKKDSNNIWGFTEAFSLYRTEVFGNIKVTLVVTPQGELSEPYVYRDNQFIPLRVIDEEMGIEKYIKAKKPFYSRLNDGFIAFIKAGTNYDTGEHVPEKSDFIVYKPSGNIELETPSKGTIHLTRVLDVPEQVRDLMTKLSIEIASCKGNREEFLRNRFKTNVVEE